MKIIENIGKPDWKMVKDHLFKEGKIMKIDLIRLISAANLIFSEFIFFKENFNKFKRK